MSAVKQHAPHFGLIVHIGAASIEDSKELARHAESIGAPAIASIPPVFFKPENVPDLVSTMQDIAAAAPKTPFYYYRIHMRWRSPVHTTNVFNICSLTDF
jgi:N-acetylneuraminate lyase